MGSGDRVQRLVFGEAATDYDRYRPHYPDELFELLVPGDTGAEPITHALDVGSGTARAASALADRGLDGCAVEPDPAMAAVARANLPDTWSVEISDFERCAAADRTDWPLITCAQAWHWIDHDRGLARAHEILRPGGTLALFWNRPHFHADDLRRTLDAVYDRFAPNMQSSLRGRGAEPKGRIQGIDTDRPPIGWAQVSLDELRWEATYTTDQWVRLLGTHSDHRMLDPGVRTELHGAVAEAIDDHGGSFVLPYRVEVIRFRR